MSSHRFADATAVRPEADGRYATQIAEGWDIGGNSNGGYLLAVLSRALRDASGRPDAVSVTAHYLSPGRAGAATATTAIMMPGISGEPVVSTRRCAT